MSSNYVQYLRDVSNNINRRAELLKKSGKWKASDKKHLEDKIYKAKHEIETAISSAERTKDISGDSFVIDTRLDDKISSIESLSNEIANEYSSMESSSLNSYQSEDTLGQKTQKVGELIVNVTEKPREYQFVANKETDLFSSSIPANIEIASDPYKEDYMKNYGVTADDIDYLKLREKKAEDDTKLFIATEQGKKIFGDDLKDSHIILRNLFLDKSIDHLLKKPIIEIIKKFKLEDGLIGDYSFNGYASVLDGYYAPNGKIVSGPSSYTAKDYLISKIIFKLLSCAKYKVSASYHIIKYKNVPSIPDQLKNNYPHIEVRVINDLIKKFVNEINDILHTSYFDAFVIFILALFHKASSEETKDLSDVDVSSWYSEIMSTYVNNNNTYKKYKEIYGKYQIKNNLLNDMFLMQEEKYPRGHDYSKIIPHEYRRALLAANGIISYANLEVVRGVGVTRKPLPDVSIIDYVPVDEAKLHEGLLLEEQKKILQELEVYHASEEAALLIGGNAQIAVDVLKAEQVNNLQNNIYAAQLLEVPRGGVHRDDYDSLRSAQITRIKLVLNRLKITYKDLKPPKVLHLVKLDKLHKNFVRDLRNVHVANRTEMRLDATNVMETKIANDLETYQLQEAKILIDSQKLEDPTLAVPLIVNPTKTDYDTLRTIQSSIIQHNIATMKNKHLISIPLEILRVRQTEAEQKQRNMQIQKRNEVNNANNDKNNARLLHANISLQRLALQRHILSMLTNKSELLKLSDKLAILNGKNTNDIEANNLLVAIKSEEKNTNELALDNINGKNPIGGFDWPGFKIVKQAIHTLIGQGVISEDGKIQAANQATHNAILNTLNAITTAETSKTAADIQNANTALAAAQVALAAEVTAIQVLQQIITNALITTLAQARNIINPPVIIQQAPQVGNVIPQAPQVGNVIPPVAGNVIPPVAGNVIPPVAGNVIPPQVGNVIPQAPLVVGNGQQQVQGGTDPPVDSSRNLTSFNQAIIVGAITMILVLIWSLFGSSKTATDYDRTTYDDQLDYYDQLDYDETYYSQIDKYEYYNYENHDGDGSYYYDDDSTDYNGYYNAETYGDNNGQYQSEYDEKNNDYVSNNYKNIDLDFIKYDQYGHGYAYYADLY